MEQTLNETLFIILQNLTCIFSKKSSFRTCTSGKISQCNLSMPKTDPYFWTFTTTPSGQYHQNHTHRHTRIVIYIAVNRFERQHISIETKTSNLPTRQVQTLTICPGDKWRSRPANSRRIARNGRKELETIIRCDRGAGNELSNCHARNGGNNWRSALISSSEQLILSFVSVGSVRKWDYLKLCEVISIGVELERLSVIGKMWKLFGHLLTYVTVLDRDVPMGYLESFTE